MEDMKHECVAEGEAERQWRIMEKVEGDWTLPWSSVVWHERMQRWPSSCPHRGSGHPGTETPSAPTDLQGQTKDYMQTTKFHHQTHHEIQKFTLLTKVISHSNLTSSTAESFWSWRKLIIGQLNVQQIWFHVSPPTHEKPVIHCWQVFQFGTSQSNPWGLEITFLTCFVLY